MREILFRGNREDGKGWVYGHYHNATYTGYPNGGDDKITRHYILPQNAGDAHVVFPETVGQFTGLKDNNGKEIFEGDILHIVSDTCDYNFKTSVGAKYGYVSGFYVDGDFDGGDFNEIGFAFDYWSNEDAEVKVIGNIHDNPELLEVER